MNEPKKIKRLYIARIDNDENIILGIIAQSWKEAKQCAITFADELGGDDLSWWELMQQLQVKWRRDIDISDLPYGTVDTKIGVERGIYYCEL